MRLCFALFLVLTLLLAGCVSAEPSAIEKETATARTTNCVILDHRGSAELPYVYTVVGELVNTGKTDKQVIVYATFYDAEGRVVDSGWSYAKPPDVFPGEKAAFRIAWYILPTSENLAEKITNYSLRTDC